MVCRARPLEDVGVNTTFWRGRRVLMTGHTGFKGAWLALWLQRLGAELCGFALAPPSQPSLFEAIGIGQLMQSRIADVRDLAALQSAVADFAPEVVFHLAAQSLVCARLRRPSRNVCNQRDGHSSPARSRSGAPTVRATVVVTSDKCYENREWVCRLPRGRSDGRARSVLEQQRLRRARRGSLSRFVPSGALRWPARPR